MLARDDHDGVRAARRLPDGDVVVIPVGAVIADRQVRLAGVNEHHVASLVESREELPPIVVNRLSMRVVDGVHRLRAAEARGERGIAAVFVDGDDTSDFVLAVELNAGHGLPLTRRDRTAAVDRLLASYPEWSDRRIAAVVGVAHTTVAGRRRSTGRTHRWNVGRDGRVRPADPAAGRSRVALMLAERPDAPVREVARLAGVSPTTVLNVRRREAGTVAATLPPAPAPDLDRLMESLLADPSLRHTSAGRTLLRLLSLTLGLRSTSHLVSAVPAHTRPALADLARRSAEQWLRTAEQLEVLDPTAQRRSS